MALLFGQGPGIALLEVQGQGIGAGFEQQAHHCLVPGLGGVHQRSALQFGAGVFERGAMGDQQLGDGGIAMAGGPGQGL